MDVRVKGDLIPEEDDVVRHCRLSDYYDPGNGDIRVNGDAFKPDADGVSVTWIEFFPGSREEQLAEVSATIRTTRKVRSSHRLAIISVGAVTECGQTYGVDLTVEHDPITNPPPNLAHCLIKGIPDDAIMLREQLALNAQATVFSQH
jgi:hypothetical protein